MKNDGRHTKVAKNAISLSVVSVLVVLISFVKESVIAYHYGATAYTDAYNISIDTPTIIFTFISMAISTVVVPVYTKTLVECDRDRANYFFRNFTTMVFISYLAVVLAGELCSYYLLKVLAPGLASETIHLATRFFRLTLPAMGLGLLCKINTGVLNSYKNFLLPSLSPIFFNLAISFSIIAFEKKIGIYAAIVGIVFGMGLELLYTSCLRNKYVRYKPTLNIHDETTISALKMAGPVFLGMGATEINVIVDKVLASFFEEGSISALNYASKLSRGISTLFIASITTVIFPELAGHIANRDEKKAAETYIFSIRLFIILLMPIIVGGVFLSREIMILVYGRGAFDLSAVNMTTPIFSAYFVALLFTGGRQVGMNFLYSHGDSKTAMKNTVIGVGVNVILDIVLSKIMGVVGLAIATTLSVAVISILLMRSAKQKNAYVFYRECLLLFFQTFLACGGMLAVIWLFKKLFVYVGCYDENVTKMLFIFTVGAVFLGACVYFLELCLLRVNEMLRFWGMMKSKLIKLKNGKV